MHALWIALSFASFCNCAAASPSGEKSTPKGHLKPFGEWTTGTPVEERSDVPEPEEFYSSYCEVDGGQGKPVIFRGAARGMAAMKWTTDDVLIDKYGNAEVTGVEYNLKETRAGGNLEHVHTMKDFLAEYNKSDIYMVSKVPKDMQNDVSFLPFMRCGGFLRFLDTNNLWFGRGGSKSVVHYDDQDNINCMFSGKKRFIMMHPSYKKKFEAHPNTKKNKFGWVDTDLDETIPGYGAFMGGIDVDRMDLIKYPGWKKVAWSYADLEPGDCIYIPYQWYHQVTAAPMRSINTHVWYWRPEKFSCKDKSAPAPRFSDCTWGYEPDQGHFGTKAKKPFTKCRKPKSEAKRGEL